MMTQSYAGYGLPPDVADEMMKKIAGSRQKMKEKNMNIDPVNSWVAVDPLEKSDKVGSLIVVQKNDSYRRGKVTALPYELDPKVQHLRIGNVIIYDSLGSIEIGLGETKITLVKTVEIVAVVRE